MRQQTSVVFRDVRVLGDGDRPIERGSVWVEGGRIATVDGEPSAPGELKVVAGEGLTLMPGLIDAHLHILGISSYDFDVWMMEDPALHVARGVADMARLVDAGFTTVRDAGSDTSLGLKAAQREGSIRGPRMWASGRWISSTGNLPDIPHLPFCVTHNRGMGVVADGVDECRRAVREQIRAGADIIKIASTGGIDPSFVVAEYTWSDDELRAIVDTAHGFGRRVSVHNNVLPGVPPTGMRRALAAGVDTIEHGYFVPDDVLAAMAERGTWLVVTASYLKLVSEGGRKYGLSDIYVDKATLALESVLDTIPRARRAGVRIACGSDLLGTPLDPHGTNAMELGILRDAGFSDREVVRVATKANAEALGIDGWTGRIAEGYAADLLLVEGRPDEDIEVLTDPGRIKYVMVAGVEQKDEISADRAGAGVGS
ncbi:MAG TPA: amidohydrolase family protein [Actinomycetes bacterium]|nr:amidohydrolase family protein [Actinomycetes bacterium]